MLSLAIKFFVSMLIFNWMCAEVNSVAPEAMGYLDQVSEAFAIPTHDKWGLDLSAIDGITSWFNKAEKDAGRVYRKHMSSLPTMSREKSNSVFDSVGTIKRFLTGNKPGIGRSLQSSLERF